MKSKRFFVLLIFALLGLIVLISRQANAFGSTGNIENQSAFTVQVINNSNGEQILSNQSTPSGTDHDGIWSLCQYNTDQMCPYKLGETDNVTLYQQPLLPPGYVYITGSVNCESTSGEHACGWKNHTGYGPNNNFVYGSYWENEGDPPDISHAYEYVDPQTNLAVWYIWWVYLNQPMYVILQNNMELCNALGLNCITYTDPIPQIDNCADPDLFLDGVAVFDSNLCHGENRYWVSSDARWLGASDLNFASQTSSVYVQDGWSALLGDGDPNHILCTDQSLWDLSIDYYPGTSVNMNNTITSITVFENDTTCGGFSNNSSGGSGGSGSGGGSGTSTKAQLFTLANYGGSSYTFDIGQHDNLNADTYSLSIEGGNSVVLYDQIGFTGDSRCWAASVPNLQDHSWHLRARSLIVYNSNVCGGGSGNGEVKLFELANYGGSILWTGSTGFSNTPSGTYFAMELPSGWSAKTWYEDNRGGNERCWNSSVANLQDHEEWWHRLESIEIFNSDVCNGGGNGYVELFRVANYSDKIGDFGIGSHNFSPNTLIFSVKLQGAGSFVVHAADGRSRCFNTDIHNLQDHESWWYETIVMDVFNGDVCAPPPTQVPLPTPVPTSMPTNTPQPTATSAPRGLELLSAPWHLEANNGADELYQSIDPNVLVGASFLRVTYDLHGSCVLGNDASAIIFDQNGWNYVSLSDYGQNCLDGAQTVDVPLVDFGLDLNQTVGTFHTRFWYGSALVVDISSALVIGENSTPVPTNTPLPPTNTPIPTNVPNPTATPSPTETSLPGDTARYNFENGSIQGFEGAGGIISGVSNSYSYSYMGNNSLCINISFPGGGWSSGLVFVSDTDVQSDKTMTVHLYVPAEVNGVSSTIYFQDENWGWHESGRVDLISGQWTTLTWDLSSESFSFTNRIGLNLGNNNAYTGCVYIDTWEVAN